MMLYNKIVLWSISFTVHVTMEYILHISMRIYMIYTNTVDIATYFKKCDHFRGMHGMSIETAKVKSDLRSPDHPNVIM